MALRGVCAGYGDGAGIGQITQHPTLKLWISGTPSDFTYVLNFAKKNKPSPQPSSFQGKGELCFFSNRWGFNKFK